MSFFIEAVLTERMYADDVLQGRPDYRHAEWGYKNLEHLKRHFNIEEICGIFQEKEDAPFGFRYRIYFKGSRHVPTEQT